MIQFPVALLMDSGSFQVFRREEAFIGPTGARHPPEAWLYWTPEDWANQCPGWRPVPLVEGLPYDAAKVIEPRPEADWQITETHVQVTYTVRDKTPAETEASKPPVPTAVTNFQARAALLTAGLFDRVNDALLAMPANSTARQAWEYANELTRNGTLVNSMAETLGLTAAQLDDLFRQAATIEA